MVESGIKRFLACDIGAESGRVILGTLADSALSIEELHRFPNEPVQLPAGLYWDTPRLFHEMLKGFRVAGHERKLTIDGIGIDTWGVDFALLDRDGALCDNARHYRDVRNHGMLEKLFAVVPREQIFRDTGIQFMQINSLCQLYAQKLQNAQSLEAADTLLFIPDLLNYWLTGEKAAEVTIASTSQFYDPQRKTWSTRLLQQLGLRTDILPRLIEPGTQLGTLLPQVEQQTGVHGSSRGVPVYATASHDTASAVAAIPAESGHWCYISSGTWSLMGVELDHPIIDDRSLAHNFTNEAGVQGTTRLLKNIAGLWLVQECRRAWALEGHDYSYEELTAMASDAPVYAGHIDPDAFLEAGDMPERIARWCRSHSQPVPEGPAAMTRAILQSLATRYRQVLEILESLTGTTIDVIHIVGGGSRNRLLNQLVANTTGRTVIAGPAEATAIGNILVQAMGAGNLRDLSEARDVVRRSVQLETFRPEQVYAIG
jgi:rhamnulokinase